MQLEATFNLPQDQQIDPYLSASNTLIVKKINETREFRTTEGDKIYFMTL